MWQVLYKIWSLDSLTEICRFLFEIPHTEMPRVSALDTANQHSPSFRFPIALSPSLRRLVILDVMFKIDQQLDIAREYTCQSQVLPAMGCLYCSKRERRILFSPLEVRPILWPTDISPQQQGFHARNSQEYHGARYLEHDCFQWYRHHFSPDERFVLSLEGHNPLSDIENYRNPVLTIFESKDGDGFSPVASVSLQMLLHTDRQEYSVLKFICFHPCQPIVAISTFSEIVIWLFTAKGAWNPIHRSVSCSSHLLGSSLVKVYHEPLENITFSRCGNFLTGNKPPPYGFLTTNDSLRGGTIIFSVARFLGSSLLLQPAYSQSSLDGTSSQVLANQSSNTGVLSPQTSLTPVFDLTGRKPQISMLRQSTAEGMIALQTVRDDGVTIERTMTRIPQSSTLEKSFATIAQSDSPENVRLVLNMATQESYSIRNQNTDFDLPAVIDRRIETIQTVVSIGQPFSLRANRQHTSQLQIQ